MSISHAEMSRPVDQRSAVSEAEIKEWAEHYRRRPWIAEEFYAGALITMTEAEIYLRNLDKSILRNMIRVARTRKQQRQVIAGLAVAVRRGHITAGQARASLRVLRSTR